MMVVSSKILTCFKTSKFGLSEKKCSDSFAVSADGMAMAIADGVTKSYFSRFVSKPLTEQYVTSAFVAGELFDDKNIIRLLSMTRDYWDLETREYEASVDEDTASDLAYQRERFGMGASTFAGIKITDEALAFDVLGDSCIFIIPDSPEITPMILTSMPASTDSKQEKPFVCNFGTHPHFLDTNGRMVGEPLSGKITPFPCTIILMTDALADWFCRNYTLTNGGKLIGLLKSIDSQKSFNNYISLLRDQDLHNDDVTLIVAEISVSCLDFEHPWGKNIKGLLPSTLDQNEETDSKYSQNTLKSRFLKWLRLS